MAESRKLAAILAADVVGYSRMTGADEDGTLARLRILRRELIDPTVGANNGRVFKRTGDGVLVEFRSVVDAVRCAIEVQKAMIARNAAEPDDRRIAFRVGVHLGDVVEESDGDLMGDGVNIAARLEGVAEPGGVCLSSAAYEQVRDKLRETFVDLGEQSLKNIARAMRVYAFMPEGGRAPAARSAEPAQALRPRLSIVVLPFANFGGDPEQDYFVDGVTESLTTDLSRIRGSFVIAPQHGVFLQGKAIRREDDRPGAERALRARRKRSAQRRPDADQRPAHRRRERQSSLGRTLRQARGRPLRHAGRDRRAARGPDRRPSRRRRSAARGAERRPRFYGSLFSGQGLAQQGHVRGDPGASTRIF